MVISCIDDTLALVSEGLQINIHKGCVDNFFNFNDIDKYIFIKSWVFFFFINEVCWKMSAYYIVQA